MLDRGIKFFNNLRSEMADQKRTQVRGDQAFFLYDSLGFPVDLTELMAEEAGLTVDLDGFAAEMEAQKTRSREARYANKAGGGKRLELIAEQTAWLADRAIATTDDDAKFQWHVAPEARVQALFSAEGFLTDRPATEGQSLGIVLDRSPFYAEAGGQENDVGVLVLPGGGTFRVDDVQSYGGYLLHTGRVETGEVNVGDAVVCQVDYEPRKRTAPNHTMTHVLNSALRAVLGDGVDQRGSLCNADKLRFDFSHKKAMKPKQLKGVESRVREIIDDGLPVTSLVMPLKEATEIPGVRAVFGEVYPDPVRVVTVGDDASVEFCGGTHLANTAEAEAFVLLEETAVAKGVRRITAVTGASALRAIEEGTALETRVGEAESFAGSDTDLEALAVSLRKDIDAREISAPLKADLRGRIEALQKKAAAAKKALLAMRVDRALNAVGEQILDARTQGQRVLVTKVDIGADGKAANKVVEAVRSLAPEMAFMGVSEEEEDSGGKVLCFTVVPEGMVEEGLRADEWVRNALEASGGRGGGKPNAAQGQAKACDDVGGIMFAGTVFATEKAQGASV